MYKVKKTMEISASHSLHFSKAGADEPMHGHNWTVTVWCRGRELDEDGLLVDFLDIEKRPAPRISPAGSASRCPTATGWT